MFIKKTIFSKLLVLISVFLFLASFFSFIMGLLVLFFGFLLESANLDENLIILTVPVVFLIAFLSAYFLSLNLRRTFRCYLAQFKKGIEMLSEGDLIYKIQLQTGDEFWEITEAFNRMTENFQKLLSEQKEQLSELNRTTKVLIRRDLEFAQTRTKQEEQIVELERIARILVRRDVELTAAKERLEILNREKSEFISIVAHQFRTPLTGIKWPLSVLQKRIGHSLAGRNKILIQQTLDSTEKMIAMVNDFLNVVRIEEGRSAYVFRPHNFSLFIEGVVQVLKNRIEEKSIKFILDIDKNTPKEVVFDDEKMFMALQNILDNAIKFSPKKGEVSCAVKIQAGKGIIFSITDNGIGIPKDEYDKIFLKFSMASNAITYEGGKGSGLGLYLAKNIIEAHGGKIWFISEAEKGITFYFTIPFIDHN